MTVTATVSVDTDASSPAERTARAYLARIRPSRELRALAAVHGVTDTANMLRRDALDRIVPDAMSTMPNSTVQAVLADAARAELAHVNDLELAASIGARIVIPSDDEWPTGLDDLGDDAPWCLWVRGTSDLAATVAGSVAVVGARASTAYGDAQAGRIAIGLAAAGVTVVSGAAYGIDAAAHRAVLSEHGTTVAVLAGGVDVPYPRAHADLITRIAATGLVVSEVPPGSAPTRARFLARNRIIAALSAGTVMVESTMQSGSRNALAHAARMGRAHMAVPGSAESPLSDGCHDAIRSGAVLVTGPGDVLNAVC